MRLPSSSVTNAPLGQRDMLFVSHANPEDNIFTNWLALQLAREGYAVWCDLTKLLGGESFWDDIQVAIEQRASKFLYVLSRSSNNKEGALAELTVARDVQKKLGIHDFIIPLHIDDLPHNAMHILLRRLNTIPFRNSWAAGLNQLVRKLREESVPKDENLGPKAVNDWWKTHFSVDKGIRNQPEEILSNHFSILGIPKTLYAHALTPGHADYDLRDSVRYPAILQGDSLISFAKAEDLQDTLGNRRIWRSRPMKLDTFLQEQASRNHIYSLLRLAWETMADTKGLHASETSNGKAFYFVKDQLLKDRMAFDRPDGSRGYRSLVGYTTVGRTVGEQRRLRYWHYAVRAVPDLGPNFGFWIKSHVLFSDDGRNIWTNPAKLHSARRSQCKDWWNDQWRDRLLAMMQALAGEASEITVPLGRDLSLRMHKFPALLCSPVSYTDPAFGMNTKHVDEDGMQSSEGEYAE